MIILKAGINSLDKTLNNICGFVQWQKEYYAAQGIFLERFVQIQQFYVSAHQLDDTLIC